jgi:hypothetical protein
MAEVSSPHLTNSLIPTAEQINTPNRVGAADIAHLLQHLLTSGLTPPAAGVVMGGLAVTGKVNDMRVDVGEGAGAIYDGTVSAPKHPFELAIVRDDDTSAALNDGDGSFDRIDVISITPLSALLDTEPVLEIGGGTTPVPTRRGPDYTINITEGTPSGSPSAPATPSGAIKLAEVLVPTGLTAGGGGTSAATITDYRNRAGAEIKGPDSPSSGWIQQTDDFSLGGISALLTALGVRDDTGKALGLGISFPFHLPVFSRVGAAAGEYNGALYPMLLVGDRTHELSAPFNAGDPSDADASVNTQGFGAIQFGGVRVAHLTANATTVRVSATFPTPARGASFGTYRLKYEVETAEPATLQARAVAYDASADAVINLSDLTTIAKTVGTHDVALDNPVEFLPAIGDIVGIRVDIGFAAAADSAAMELRSGTARITEGRA